jgi:hypothetical protein
VLRYRREPGGLKPRLPVLRAAAEGGRGGGRRGRPDRTRQRPGRCRRERRRQVPSQAALMDGPAHPKPTSDPACRQLSDLVGTCQPRRWEVGRRPAVDGRAGGVRPPTLQDTACAAPGSPGQLSAGQSCRQRRGSPPPPGSGRRGPQLTRQGSGDLQPSGQPRRQSGQGAASVVASALQGWRQRWVGGSLLCVGGLRGLLFRLVAGPRSFVELE